MIIDSTVDNPERYIDIVLDNGEYSRTRIKHTVSIETAIAIAIQFAEDETIPTTVAWSSQPKIEQYLSHLE